MIGHVAYLHVQLIIVCDVMNTCDEILRRDSRRICDDLVASWEAATHATRPSPTKRSPILHTADSIFESAISAD